MNISSFAVCSNCRLLRYSGLSRIGITIICDNAIENFRSPLPRHADIHDSSAFVGAFHSLVSPSFVCSVLDADAQRLECYFPRFVRYSRFSVVYICRRPGRIFVSDHYLKRQPLSGQYICLCA